MNVFLQTIPEKEKYGKIVGISIINDGKANTCVGLECKRSSTSREVEVRSGYGACVSASGEAGAGSCVSVSESDKATLMDSIMKSISLEMSLPVRDPNPLLRNENDENKGISVFGLNFVLCALNLFITHHPGLPVISIGSGNGWLEFNYERKYHTPIICIEPIYSQKNNFYKSFSGYKDRYLILDNF